MIGYVTLGTRDKDRALAFYDALLAELGAKQMFNNERLYFYGTEMGKPMIAVGGPYDEQAATHGNGTMLALPMESREQVESIYAKALELGGADEGAPGDRGNGFYGAYFRDLDGNKFCLYKFG
ncbi:MAG: VOC family protein [Gammaproteobacteria bacterium AqS3]|nr:VOC family protein [Gammaproteobacteria bacterium AqS3]